MKKLQKEDGNWAKTNEEIGSETTGYYMKLFSNSNNSSNVQEILEWIPKSITEEMNRELIKSMTEEEIKLPFFLYG